MLWRVNSSNVDNFSPVVGIEFIHSTYHPRESSSGEHYLPDPIVEGIHVILFFLIYIPLMSPFMGIVEFAILFIVLHMLIKKM
ncbi:MAG: hypothetical protein J7L47_08340 [Candidatus Odinarchaeota archaeon]|nr:hypothetical protein [Candidatus Odinarchaeota archaeon]